MLKTILKLSLASVLLIAAQACTLGATTPSPDTIKTAIAATSSALNLTPQPGGIPITGATSTPTPTIVTATPTVATSPTAALSSTASVPQVSVYVATNCRTGPSIAYPRVGGLAIGQVAQVVGRNANNTYWIIQNPDVPGQTCWLWGQFATVIGDIGALPVLTPPPPPPPTAAPSPAITLTPAPTSMSPTAAPSATSTATP